MCDELNSPGNAETPALHFDLKHSHHWLSLVDTVARRLKEYYGHPSQRVLLKELMLGGPLHHSSSAPGLLTALRYWINMQHKMAFEVQVLCELLDLRYEQAMVDLRAATMVYYDKFRDDMRLLLSAYESPSINQAMRAINQSPESLFFMRTWRQKLVALDESLKRARDRGAKTTVSSACDRAISDFLTCALEARLAQEYFTLMGALLTIEGIKREGFSSLVEKVANRSELAAFQLCWILFIGMPALFATGSGLLAKSHGWSGMKCDHIISVDSPLSRISLGNAAYDLRRALVGRPLRVAMELMNCPIYDAYTKLSPIHDAAEHPAGIFCILCEQHGALAYQARLPVFLRPVTCTLSQRLSSGARSCKFDLELQVCLTRTRAKKKLAIWQRIRQSQPPLFDALT